MCCGKSPQPSFSRSNLQERAEDTYFAHSTAGLSHSPEDLPGSGQGGSSRGLVFVPARLRNGAFCQTKWAYIPALQPRAAYLGQTCQRSTFPEGAGETKTKPTFAALFGSRRKNAAGCLQLSLGGAEVQPTRSEPSLPWDTGGTHWGQPPHSVRNPHQLWSRAPGVFLSVEGAPAVLRQGFHCPSLPIICFSHPNNEASS